VDNLIGWLNEVEMECNLQMGEVERHMDEKQPVPFDQLAGILKAYPSDSLGMIAPGTEVAKVFALTAQVVAEAPMMLKGDPDRLMATLEKLSDIAVITGHDLESMAEEF
jgi:hypothetical protein